MDVPPAGLATHHALGGREDGLAPALTIAGWPGDAHAMVGRDLARLTENPVMPPPAVHRDATDCWFRFDSVEEIFAALENKGTDWASETLKNLRHMSPICLKMNLRHMGSGPSCRSIMP